MLIFYNARIWAHEQKLKFQYSQVEYFFAQLYRKSERLIIFIFTDS